MSFKNRGYKAKFKRPEYDYPEPEYIVYAVLESVSDVMVYRIFDDNGYRVFPSISEEDDGVKGKQSLIDVFYYLKHYGEGVYQFDNPLEEIVIERMTLEDLDIFREDKHYSYE